MQLPKPKKKSVPPMDVVFTIDYGYYIQLAAGPWGDSLTAAPLQNSGDFCALS
jgi:hypothetical protein